MLQRKRSPKRHWKRLGLLWKRHHDMLQQKLGSCWVVRDVLTEHHANQRSQRAWHQ